MKSWQGPLLLWAAGAATSACAVYGVSLVDTGAGASGGSTTASLSSSGGGGQGGAPAASSSSTSSTSTASSTSTTSTSTSSSSTTSSTTTSTSSTSTSSTTSSSSTSSSTSSGALTCAQVNQGVGCCDTSGVLHYCSSGTVHTKTCTGTNVCGWDMTQSYYGCVPPPGGADPSMTYPMLCP